MDDAFDDDFDDRVAQHESINQLEVWREEAKAAVLAKNPGNHVVGGISDLDDSVKAELVSTHGAEIKTLIAVLQKQKSELEARLELDDIPTQADLDRLEALNDAIPQLEFAIDA